MKADGHTAKGISKYLGVSRATLYRYLSGDDAGHDKCDAAEISERVELLAI